MSTSNTTNNITGAYEVPASAVDAFGVARYHSLPNGDATEMVGMMRALSASAPTTLRGAANEALERMSKDRLALERAIAARHAAVDDSDLRPTLYPLRGVWRCAYSRTRAVMDLPATIPEQSIARECQAVLFRDGVEFTGRSSAELLVESEIRLGLLDGPSLQAAFIRLNGAWLLDTLKGAHAAHAEYAAAARKQSQSATQAPDLSVAMGEARLSTQAYVRWILAHVDERKPETQVWAEQALAPVEALRQRKRRAMAKDGVEPRAAEDAAPSAPPSAALPAVEPSAT